MENKSKYTERTPNHYRLLMFTHGILTILYVLEYYEAIEDYTECAKIMQAIKEQEKYLNITFETRITQNVICEVIEFCRKHGMVGDNVLENSKYCAELIIDFKL